MLVNLRERQEALTMIFSVAINAALLFLDYTNIKETAPLFAFL